MTSDSDVIETKVGNAFYTDAELAKNKLASGGDLGSIIAGLFMGGAWFGGNIALTPTKLIFELNALNKAFNLGAFKDEIPLAKISKVTVIKPTIGFKIIQLTLPRGEFKIRVRGADEFASLIEATKAKAK